MRINNHLIGHIIVVQLMSFGTAVCPEFCLNKWTWIWIINRPKPFYFAFIRLRNEISESTCRILKYLSIDIRTARFLDLFCTSDDSLCNVFHDQPQPHMSQLLVKFGVEVSSWHILRNVINASFFRQ